MNCVLKISILTLIMFLGHSDIIAQTNKLEISQISNAIKKKYPVKCTMSLSRKDILETDMFVYSVSNGSVAEDIPYSITVTGSSVFVVMTSCMGEVNRSFSISETQYSHFKEELFKANIKVERNDAVIGLCGASCIELSLFKKLKNYFKYNTLDSEQNLTYNASIGNIFWKLVPVTYDELLDSIISPIGVDPDLNDLLN